MKPIRDFILIEKIEEKVQGIIIPDNNRPDNGKVLEIGKRVEEVKIGDVIYFNRNAVKEVDKYLLVKEEDVLCIKK